MSFDENELFLNMNMDAGTENGFWCLLFVFVLLISLFFACNFLFVFFGEFDPGSGRTLAACLTHASRTERPPPLVGVLEWRTGE